MVYHDALVTELQLTPRGPVVLWVQVPYPLLELKGACQHRPVLWLNIRPVGLLFVPTRSVENTEPVLKTAHKEIVSDVLARMPIITAGSEEVYTDEVGGLLLA